MMVSDSKPNSLVVMITLLVITPDFFNWLKKLLITKVSTWFKPVLHSTQKWNKRSNNQPKESQISMPMVIATPGDSVESKMIINSVMTNNGVKMHQKLTLFQHLPLTQLLHSD